MTLDRRSFVAGGAGLVLTGRDLSGLRAKIRGTVIEPKDPDYERARRSRNFNPSADKRPRVIVGCADAEDVARSVAFARERGLELAVKSGGNDALGACGVEGGILIDLSRMNRSTVDPAARLATAGPGLSSGGFTQAAAPFGLTAVLGCNPDVGVGGLLLGGGIGWFLGTEGAACDQVEAVELVTADARIVRASAAENTDLFWAVRGGGGNFGVATAFRCRLRPSPTVLAGIVGFRTDLAAFLRFYRDYMAQAPDPLAVELNVYAGGPPGSGPPIVTAVACWNGDPQTGETVLRPLRRYAQPVIEAVSLQPFARFAGPHGDPRPPAAFSIWRGASLSVISDAAISGLVEVTAKAPRGWSLGMGHHLHGKITQVAATDHAMLRPAHQTTFFLSAAWGEPRGGEASLDWIESSMTDLRPVISPETYINYLSDGSRAAVARAYGPNFDRLQKLKRRYDPADLFRNNRNIRAS